MAHEVDLKTLNSNSKQHLNAGQGEKITALLVLILNLLFFSFSSNNLLKIA